MATLCLRIVFALTIVCSVMGQQLGQQQTASKDDCAKLCSTTPECGQYTFSGYDMNQPGLCTLSKGAEAPAPTPVPATNGAGVILYNTNNARNNDALLVANAVDAKACEAKCAAHKSCNSFVHYQTDCYLKSGIGPMQPNTPTPSTGVTTGLMNRAGEGKCLLIGATSQWYKDLVQLPGTDPDVCCDECIKNSQCTTFVIWSGKCWLKTRGTGVDVPGATLGLVVARSGW